MSQHAHGRRRLELRRRPDPRGHPRGGHVRKAVVGGITAAVVAFVVAGVAGADSSYTDPSGDSGAAPDITGIAVANDPATGLLTLRITTNQPSLAAAAALFITFDTDRNPATGAEGFDYAGAVGANAAGLGKWNGSDWDFDGTPRATLLTGYGGGVGTFSINRSELGNTSGFDFFVTAAQLGADGSIAASDIAPNGDDLYSYTLAAAPAPKPKPLVLTAGNAVGKPGRPQAGSAFTATVPVKRSDTGGSLAAGGTLTCRITVGGKAVRATGNFGAGGARCGVRVPAGAKGKTLRGTMTVTFNGARVVRAFSFRVV
jgi:hypothetical protein